MRRNGDIVDVVCIADDAGGASRTAKERVMETVLGLVVLAALVAVVIKFEDQIISIGVVAAGALSLFMLGEWWGVLLILGGIGLFVWSLL